ncbi:hypothetical protein ACOME3_002783 [Neoechinorhynchus agilis]
MLLRHWRTVLFSSIITELIQLVLTMAIYTTIAAVGVDKILKLKWLTEASKLMLKMMDAFKIPILVSAGITLISILMSLKALLLGNKWALAIFNASQLLFLSAVDVMLIYYMVRKKYHWVLPVTLAVHTFYMTSNMFVSLMYYRAKRQETTSATAFQIWQSKGETIPHEVEQ